MFNKVGVIRIFGRQLILKEQQTETDAEWHGVAPPFARPLTSRTYSVPIKPAEKRGSIGRFRNTVRTELLRRYEIWGAQGSRRKFCNVSSFTFGDFTNVSEEISASDFTKFPPNHTASYIGRRYSSASFCLVCNQTLQLYKYWLCYSLFALAYISIPVVTISTKIKAL
jgi:hypothetical protein